MVGAADSFPYETSKRKPRGGCCQEYSCCKSQVGTCDAAGKHSQHLSWSLGRHNAVTWQWGVIVNLSLGPFVAVGSKVMGEDRKGRGHFSPFSLLSCLELVMVMNILVLCSNLMLIVEKLHSLSSLLPD